jgi:hypothetical protein
MRDFVLYKALLIVYNTLGLILKMALWEEPKHVAVKNDLIIYSL